MQLRYQIAMSDPDSHLYEVELEVLDVDHAYLDLVMPAWTPGSYLIREYARHVQRFSAEGTKGALRWEKVAKHTWRVDCEGLDRLRARYKVYANELSVRTSHLDRTHGFFNGATVFMYVDGAKDVPSTVTVLAPKGWRITTGLPVAMESREAVGSALATSRVLHARNFDELVDSPVECGRHRLIEFDHAGIAHRIAIWGRPFVQTQGGGLAPTLSDDRLKQDFQKLVAEGASIFGELPYKTYTFIVHLVPGARGGLEHKNSSTLHTTPFVFRHPDKYEDFLTLVAHEHFHTWNVKRIRPEPLGPFDYTQEAYTRALWAMEGITDYYDKLNVRRAGLMRPQRFLEKIAEQLKTLSEIPGRALMSLEQSSFDAWIKLYRPDESSPNTTVSYYLKGSVVAMVLDLELRRRTQGRRSLDDVMRALWQRFRMRGEGLPEDGFESVFAEVAGGSVADLFDAYIRGTDEIDLDRHLAIAGLSLVRESAAAEPSPGGEPQKPIAGDLGARTRSQGDRVLLTHVYAGGPAAAAGLYADDELVALDGFRVTDRTLAERLEAIGPDGEVEATVFRRDELTTLPIRLGRPPASKFRLVKRPDASPLAQRIYEQWLEAPWDEASAESGAGKPVSPPARPRSPAAAKPARARAKDKPKPRPTQAKRRAAAPSRAGSTAKPAKKTKPAGRRRSGKKTTSG